MEEQILLRVPPEIALRLNRLIDEGKSSSSPSTTTSSTTNQSPISLTFTSNTSVTLHCDKQSLDGTLVELPTIIETLKTFDNIAYYKTADIAQMIILHAAQQPATNQPATISSSQPTNPPASSSASASSSQPTAAAAATDKAKDAVPPPPIKYPSGLLPPTRDIRPKRFERDTLIQPRIVSDVETMLMYIRDETPVHTFRLIEEEVEIEVDDEDEWEDEADTAATGAAGALTATPASGARAGTSSSSQPNKSSPLPTIRIDTDTTASNTVGLSPSASALRPPTSSRMSPSFSPSFLGGGGGSGTPSFTPSLGTTDEEDERMRDAGMVADEELGLLPSPRMGGVAGEEEKAFVAGLGGGKEEKGDEQAKGDEEMKVAAEVGSQAVAEAAGKDSRKSVLVAELSDVERRIEEVNVAINKEQNRLLKRRLQNERLQPLEEERNAKKKELEAL